MSTMMTIPASNTILMSWRLSGAAHPPVLHTLSIGEVARRAALACLAGPQRELLPARLAGHSPLTAHTHRHPFYLPVDSDGDGFIDHLAVHFPDGLELERTALLLNRLTRLWLPDGQAWTLVPASLPALTAASTIWESATPYLLTRYPKLHHNGRPKLNDRGEQRDGPIDHVRREWAQRQREWPELPSLEQVDLIPALTLTDGTTIEWREFDCQRQNGHMTTSGLAFGLRLIFSSPLPGPLTLGAGSHFGLGQFRPTQFFIQT
jgi:CRISPR-associated protein Csb2